MTPEQIAELRRHARRIGDADIAECLDEIERLQSAQFTPGQASSLAYAVRMDERRNIAAWLRAQSDEQPCVVQDNGLAWAADAIEEGEHLK